MSNYTKTTDFEAKDSLPSGDSGKIIRGSEFETEFDNIATAIATKADAADPTFTGTVTIDGLTVNGNTTLGNAATDTVTVTADIASNLIPSADDTYNLGASGAEWNDLYVDGVAYIDTIDGAATSGDFTFTGASYNAVWDTSDNALEFSDNAKATFGASSDLQIYHGGGHSYIRDTGTGDLRLAGTNLSLMNASFEKYFTGTSDGAATIYYDNAEKLATTSTGIDVTGVITTDGMTTSADINFGDNDKAVFGAGSDLQIYHDGSNSYIRDAGTGNLRVTSDSTVFIAKHNDENMLRAVPDGSVSLYYDGSEKLETTSTGVDVTGTVTADGLTVNSGATSTTVNFQNSGTAYSTLYNDTNGVVIFSADAGNTGAAPRMQFNVGGNQAFRITDGGDVSLYEDTGTTAKFFWDASAESLGIGTSSPASFQAGAENLVVGSGSGDEGMTIYSGTANRGNIYFADGTTSSDPYRGQINYFHDSDSLRFVTSATERMRIDSNGNVGIGTDSPSALLNVAGVSANPVLLFTRTENVSGNGHLRSEGNTGIVNAEIQLGSGSEDVIKFATDGGVDTNERMRIDRSGNVGIGTDSPASKLHLSTSSAGSVELARFRNEGQTNNTGLFFSTNETTKVSEIDASGATGGLLALATSGTERMRIDSSGNLLVGKTSTALSSPGVHAANNGQLKATCDSAPVLHVNRETNDGSLVNFYKDTTTVGSINSGSGGISLNSSGTSLVLSATDVGFHLDSGVFRTFSADDATVDLGSQSARFKDLHLSGGVVFGTTSGNVSSKTLDDYEEGTWTPVYTPSSGSFATMTMEVIMAHYTKVGDVVTINCYIRTDDVDVTGASGSVDITGLPFVSRSSCAANIGYSSAFGVNAPAGGYVSSSSLRLTRPVSGSTMASLSVSDLTDGTNANKNEIVLTATYHTTA